jgi:hypothetical protein
VGPRAVPDAAVKRKMFSPRRESNPINIIIFKFVWSDFIKVTENFTLAEPLLRFEPGTPECEPDASSH